MKKGIVYRRKSNGLNYAVVNIEADKITLISELNDNEKHYRLTTTEEKIKEHFTKVRKYSCECTAFDCPYYAEGYCTIDNPQTECD